MKYKPSSDNDHFNEWYEEFHILFEDSHGDREEVMEMAQGCYESARRPLCAILDSFDIPA